MDVFADNLKGQPDLAGFLLDGVLKREGWSFRVQVAG